MCTKTEVIKSIFEALPKLNTFWVDGDLETFYHTMIVTEDGLEGDIVLFLSDRYDALSVECGLTSIAESSARKVNIDLEHDFEKFERRDYEL